MGVDTAAADRLPWLADEAVPQPKPRRSSFRPLAATAIVLVAASGFWLGTRSVEPKASRPPQHVQPTTTVQLPPARAAATPEVRMATPPEVRPAPAPEVRPALSREVRIAAPPRARAAEQPATAAPAKEAAAASESEEQASAPASVRAAPVVPAPFVMPKPWNPRVFAGAAGRVVQVGAFGSITQAKRGWWFMVRAYPAMSRLPAVVRPTRNSKGRVFYRFQVGTTSQAHSEVLCQRMERIKFSCAVVGLPWQLKVER
jgi:SPOR domain